MTTPTIRKCACGEKLTEYRVRGSEPAVFGSVCGECDRPRCASCKRTFGFFFERGNVKCPCGA